MKSIKVVHIESGEISEGVISDDGHSFWPRYYLKADGSPDRRKHAKSVGVSRARNAEGNHSWQYHGRIVELPADDSMGEELRRQLREAQAAVEKAQLALCRHYAGEGPLPPKYLPSRHPGRQP